MVRIFLTLLSIFILSSYYVVAQKGYTLNHFTDDNGLPQNSVKSIAPGNEGYIWLATENGLSRFDGHHFYNFDKTNLSVSNNRFYVIHPSLDAIGLSASEANKKIYAIADRYESVRIENGTAVRDTSYYANKINTLPYMKEGHLRTFLASGLPNYLRYQANPPHYIIPIGNEDGDSYVCDSNKVEYYSKSVKQYEVAFKNNSIWRFFILNKKLYHFKNNHTLKKIGQNKISDLLITGEILNNPAYKGNDAVEIYWNNVSEQVYFYLNKNLYILDEEQNGNLHTKLLVEDFDLASRFIQSIHYDKRSQSLFLGSITQGLYVLKKQSFKTLITDGDEMENVFYAQVAYNNHSVLTPTGIAISKDTVTGNTIVERLPAMEKLNKADKGSLLIDTNGFIWAKTGDFLRQFDSKGERTLRQWDLRNGIKHIYQDKAGSIWIGTAENGLYKISLSDVNAQPELILKDIKVTYLASRTNEQLLVGTTNGLFIIDNTSKKIRIIKGTEGLFIKSLLVTNPEQIWLTALDKGLMLLTSGEKLVQFPLDKNKYLSSLHCVMDDSYGYLWIPTNKGLFQIATKDLLQYAKLSEAKESTKITDSEAFPELFYMYYKQDQGFRTNEFNGGCQPCGVKLANGFISLPSLNGLVWFKPFQLKAYEPDGNIILDKLEVNNILLSVKNDTVAFPLNPNQIQLHFSTPYFGNNDNLHLSYALVENGSSVPSTGWISLNNENFQIKFSSLNSGNYTLFIRKVNGFGLNNYTIKKIWIIVPPFWYETWWAKSIFILLIIATIYLYNVIRLRQIKKENSRLEDIIAKRTENLNQALGNLEESKNEMSRQIQMLSRILTSMTHDIQSPLNYITLTSNAIPKMIQQGDLRSASEIGEGIADSSQRMSDLLRGLLNYIKVYVFGNRLRFEEVNLKRLIDNKFEIFKSNIALNNSEFYNEVPASITVSSDYQMLGIVIHNLIDNAAKYTAKGTIRTYTEVAQDNKIKLIISNTGSGMPEEIMRVINDSEDDDSYDLVTAHNGKTGLGLLIIKEIAPLIHIKLIVSQTEVTSFQLIFW